MNSGGSSKYSAQEIAQFRKESEEYNELIYRVYSFNASSIAGGSRTHSTSTAGGVAVLTVFINVV